MFKVEIINPTLLVETNNERGKWEKECKTLEEAILWRDQQKGKPGREEGKALFSEPIDLSLDAEWVLLQKKINYRKESPTVEEKIHALIEDAKGNPEPLLEIFMRLNELEEKYPIKEN